MINWYDNRHLLQPDMMFQCYDNTIVKLDRRVPGDGTQWYVATWGYGHWSYDDYTIEPGDLKIKIEEPEPYD